MQKYQRIQHGERVYNSIISNESFLFDDEGCEALLAFIISKREGKTGKAAIANDDMYLLKLPQNIKMAIVKKRHQC